MPAHHLVVRALPGGPVGIPVKDKMGKATVTVDLDELRKKLGKYLEDFTKEAGPFPGKMPSLDLKNLHLVAFLQDEKTREVLQAVQVDIKPE